MCILVVSGSGNLRLQRPFVNKYDWNMMIENSIYIGYKDEIEFTETESDACDLLNQKPYRSLIISTGRTVDGCFLLDRIRSSEKLKKLAVTII